jgi:hypothetical protein
MSTSGKGSNKGNREIDQLLSWGMLLIVLGASVAGGATWWQSHRTEVTHRVLASRDIFANPDIKALNELTVRADDPMPGYTRAQFGTSWTDPDHNGCDARNDVLARDLGNVLRSGKCVVTSGTLVDPYRGTVVTFVKTNAGAVDIDHVVALAEAWRSGAAHWPLVRRAAFANDQANLIATARASNLSKGDRDAALWQPQGDQRMCRYARTVVRVKHTYDLSVDQAEADRLREMLGHCS